MSKTPKLRFKEFSGDWESKKLGSLLEFKNGINASKEQYGHGRKFINVLDILSNNYITYENIIGQVDIDDDTFEKYSVGYGDVIFQRSSETREEVGTANVYLDKENNATFGGFIIRGKKVGEYDPIFMNKLLKTSSARKEITTKSGGSTRYNVGQETLSDVEVRFPKLEEQEKIASFFSLIDDKISLQGEKVEALKDYKKGMMQKIFSRKLRFKDDDGRDYPEWEEKKLGELLDKGKAGGTPKSTVKDYYNGNISFLSISDMTTQGKYINYTEKTITQLGLENSSAWLVPKNSLIYSMYASVGFVSVNKIELATSQAMFSMIINKNTNTDYVYHYLCYFKDNGINAFIETGTQGNLNSNTVKNIVIPYPNRNEQNKIALCISYLESKIEKEQEKLDYLNEYKKGLLQQMFV